MHSYDLNTAPVGLEETTAPGELPVSAGEVKRYARIRSGYNAMDVEIEGWIRAAAQKVVNDSGFALIEATYTQTHDRFPYGRTPLDLMLTNASSVDAITYRDSVSAAATFASSKWRVDLRTTPPRVQPIITECWPVTDGLVGAASIVFKAGYADRETLNAKQPLLVLAVKMLAATWFEHPEDFEHASGGNLQQNPQGYDRILGTAREDWV